MINVHNGGSIVVGIDGSAAAVHAAHWAADEAVARDVPLRLVTCVQRSDTGEDRMTLEYAYTCLRAAHTAINHSKKPVKVETAVLEGSPTTTLVEESRHTAMVCVGSVGIGRFARGFLGSTAAEVAAQAHCPVAVIRSNTPHELHEHEPQEKGSIAAQVNDSFDNDGVFAAAAAEAQLRAMPIVAVGVCPPQTGISARDELERRVATWEELYPDVQITAAPTGTSVAQFIGTHSAPISLAVLGADDASDLPRIIGAHRQPHHDHPECSVLIVRR